MTRRFAILISGRGSNMEAILDFWQRPPAAYPISSSAPVLVVSDRPQAAGLARAQARGVPAVVVDHAASPSRAAFETSLVETLSRHDVDALVLAGFMRVLSPAFVGRYAGRIVNTHPALLPSFPGRDGVSQALAAGVKVSGCTFHFVDDGVDTGPIIAQAAVPVLETDTRETLSARIQRVEHHLYPKVVAKVMAGQFHVEGRVVHLEGGGP